MDWPAEDEKLEVLRRQGTTIIGYCAQWPGFFDGFAALVRYQTIGQLPFIQAQALATVPLSAFTPLGVLQNPQ